MKGRQANRKGAAHAPAAIRLGEVARFTSGPDERTVTSRGCAKLEDRHIELGFQYTEQFSQAKTSPTPLTLYMASPQKGFGHRSVGHLCWVPHQKDGNCVIYREPITWASRLSACAASFGADLVYLLALQPRAPGLSVGVGVTSPHGPFILQAPRFQGPLLPGVSPAAWSAGRSVARYGFALWSYRYQTVSSCDLGIKRESRALRSLWRGCRNYSDHASAALSSQRDQIQAARAASFSQ